MLPKVIAGNNESPAYDRRTQYISDHLKIDPSLIIHDGFVDGALRVSLKKPVEIDLPNGDRAEVNYLAYDVIWNIVEVQLTATITLQMKDGTLCTGLPGESVKFDRRGAIPGPPLEWPQP